MLAVFLLFSFIRHRVLLEGDKTLVLMAASGTVCPSLDFKNLYTGLEGDCRIVVVEKFGYGYSDTVNRPREVATLLSDTRAALDCGHYIFHYEPEKITKEIKVFLHNPD